LTYSSRDGSSALLANEAPYFLSTTLFFLVLLNRMDRIVSQRIALRKSTRRVIADRRIVRGFAVRGSLSQLIRAGGDKARGRRASNVVSLLGSVL
jgi:hypothetical protein